MFVRLFSVSILALFLCCPVAQANPPDIQLASVLSASNRPNLSAYWVSEKFDGVRAVWDGQQLKSRSGRVIAAPDWFVAGFPDHALDGELWLGRGQFEALMSIVQRQTPDDGLWRNVRYMVFDLPAGQGDFSERLKTLETSLSHAGVPWLMLVEQFRVTSQSELDHRLSVVLSQGGEGLMLHRADALWSAGRTDALLKYKPYQDAEAMVVDYLPGKGRYAGLVGALVLQQVNGKHFAVGSGLRETDRRDPPPIGSQVTYRYRGLTKNGIPRFPSFLRVRPAE